MNASLDPSPSIGSPGTSHVLLRNTYALLACLLLLAVLGAWFGINLRITEGVAGIVALLLLLLGGYGFNLLLRRLRHSKAAWVVLATFMFFVGLMLSLTLVRWLGFYNTGNCLMTAFASAAAVMSAAAAATSALRSALSPAVQGVLTIAALVLVTGVAEWVLRSSTQLIVLSVLAGGLLGAVMLHLQHRQARHAHKAGTDEGAATPSDPVAATLGVFLVLFSGFQSLSALLGRTGDPRS